MCVRNLLASQQMSDRCRVDPSRTHQMTSELKLMAMRSFVHPATQCNVPVINHNVSYIVRVVSITTNLWHAAVGVVGELLLQRQDDLTSLNDEVPLDLTPSVSNTAFWSEAQWGHGSIKEDRGGYLFPQRRSKRLPVNL